MFRCARTLLGVALLGSVCAGSTLAAEPVTPGANARSRSILNYIEACSHRQEKRLISGQFCGFGPRARLRACEEAFERTGHWPAMIGLDYADFGRGGLETTHVNRLAIDYARLGGLVTLSAHLPNPANPNGGGLRDQGVDLASLLAPGSETHERWMKELDTLAEGLQALQDAGVVVLWRPFHEMNGSWFWWGDRDPATFIRVWRAMFDRLTREKRLKNLLWVYGPNHGKNTAAFYPGDAYVDLTGLDAYTDFVDPEHIKGYADVAVIAKPFGFTEFGPHGPERPPGDYDYRRFRDGIETHFPRACFFLSWDANWGLGRNRETRALLSHPWLVNRDDLPKSLAAGNSDASR